MDEWHVDEWHVKLCVDEENIDECARFVIVPLNFILLPAHRSIT